MKKWQTAVALGKGLVVVSGIGILFYNSVYAIVLLAPYIVVFYVSWKEKYQEEAIKKFLLQFHDFLQILSNNLRVGYSVENAIVESRRELEKQYQEPGKMTEELLKMERLIQMHIPVEKVLNQWASTIAVEEVTNFVEVFVIAKRSGGDSVEIIRKAVQNICEKIETEREIALVIAAKKLEFQVMVWIPIGILIYMRLSFSEFMEVLYGNALGVGIMTVCLGIYIGAYIWGRKIITIEG